MVSPHGCGSRSAHVNGLLFASALFMRIHHLNCVSACPLGGLLMDGFSSDSLRGRLTSHCLLLETHLGLVLIDTGYGLRDVADPRSRLAQLFLTLVKPELRAEMTAVRQ